ncbi:MAG TPA: hypothetical protein ENL03_01915, partial [Phycisphaerae bacterium]|nr:hypothetical protein [Phycisphaerae bacterium]
FSLNGDWNFIPADGSEGGTVHIPSMWSHGKCWDYPPQWAQVDCAWLERDITIPEDWTDLIIQIRFEAVAFKAEVYINEQRLGEHVGGFMPFTIPLGLAPGESAKLRVLVTGVSAVQDGYALLHPVSYPHGHEEGPVPRGIWQNVTVEGLPKLHISDCSYTFDGCDVTFNVSAVAESWSITGPLSCEPKPLENATGTVTIPAGHLQRWSQHNPALHMVEVCAHDCDGQITHRLPVRIGLRTVHIAGENLYINNEPVHLFGFSLTRHRISPALWRRDYLTLYLRTMQEIGFNSVRVHGCIGPAVIYDVCDEIGMLVDAQSSMWSSAQQGYLAGGQTFIDNALNELTEWIHRDRHHPSIIIWDTENELYRINQAWDGPGQQFINHFRKLDPTRPVMASGAAAWPHGDIIHNHCEPSLRNVIAAERQWVADNPDQLRPFIAGEWWGDTTYMGTSTVAERGGLSGFQRQPLDFTCQDDIDCALGKWFAFEIRAHRMMGIFGTFPFSIEIFLYDRLFEPNSTISVQADDKNPIRIDKVEEHPEPGWVNVRRLYVNPGWDSSLPVHNINPHMTQPVRAALSPVLIDILEEGCSLYANQDNVRTLVICNDSPDTLSGTLSILANGAEIAAIEVDVQACRQQRSEITIHPQDGKKHIALTASWGDGSAAQDVREWAVYSGPAKYNQSIAVSGIDQATETALRQRGLDIQHVTESPDVGVPWIIGDAELLDCDNVELYLRNSGKLLLLRQEHQPSFMHAGVRFRSSLQVNHAVSIPFGLSNIGRERSGVPYVNLLSDMFVDEFGSAFLGPWRSGRVADDCWLATGAEFGRSPKGIVGGKRLDEFSVVCIHSGSGDAMLSQLCLS